MNQWQAVWNSIGFDSSSFFQFVLAFAVGCILLGGIGRLAFGKRSLLCQSLSSAVGILFVYALMVVLWSLGASYSKFVAPLPFVTFGSNYLYIFPFSTSDYTQICSELLSAVALAFIANLADGFIPRGKNLFTWLLFRCVTVILAAAAHLVITQLLEAFVPAELLTYAPVILLGLMLLLLLVGALKIVVGALLATVNPLIGAFYTFFFATFVGKALTKALLTAGLLAAVVLALNYFGVSDIAIHTSALIAYFPFLLALLIIWYVVGHLM